MWYVYILKSQNHPFIYIGSTNDLERRLHEHNNGGSAATKPFRPLDLKAYVAVATMEKALSLEKYFKGGSGAAILKKRIL